MSTKSLRLFKRLTAFAACMILVAGFSVVACAEEIKWDFEADVVVIGAGGAGLPAALKAHEDGAKVLIVEANYDCGGHAAISEGQMHSGGYTVDQQKWNVKDAADLYYYDHTRGFLDSRYNNREVVRSVANSMADTFILS